LVFYGGYTVVNLHKEGVVFVIVGLHGSYRSPESLDWDIIGRALLGVCGVHRTPKVLGGLEVAAPQSVVDLVERFERKIDQYRSPFYNETQLRREFLDPLFEALGWDVNNRQGYAEVYKDVVHEDSIRIDEQAKAPDYSFRIGGQRVFFLEAKKPSVNIKTNMAPSYQIRRYGWSAKLPISILSDFEELALYDTRIKPALADKASTARVAFWTYRDYVDKWDEIAGVFSRDSVLKGSFDKYVSDSKRKRGTAEVDQAFLKEIEQWRESLARNIALRNDGITTKDLNFAVQRIIDRVIFLRICEARGIEDDGVLREVASQPGVYQSLVQVFSRADDRFNSGIFHFKADKSRSNESLDSLTPHLEIDDKVLREILKGLYYPQCPYEFSVLPADILGQVYEQFLGKVIRLTAGRQAKVEEKPEVRKAGGVYYTPSYVVDYIVDQTVGELLKHRTPKTAVNLKVLDPACGSGSFLIVAYQHLLDWHLEQYVADGPDKHMKRLYQGRHGEWRLTVEERKRILLNNIFGVDIDRQAVEVTKLSLALKLLEGETAETLGQTRQLLADRVLPDLDSNIKCGNSLIGTDFYEKQERLFLAEEELERVNVLDWDKAFPSIMAQGGFDAVVGNPPYVRGESLKAYRDYYQSKYASFHGQADLYVYFIERAVRLLAESGRFAFIVSSSFHKTAFGAGLRDWLTANASIESVVDFGGLAVFADAKDMYVCVPVVTKSRKALESVPVTKVVATGAQALEESVVGSTFVVPRSQLALGGWLLERPEAVALFGRLMESGRPLRDVAGKAYLGVKTGLTEAFEVTDTTRDALLAADPSCADRIKPFHGGRDIRRYEIRHAGRNLIVFPAGWTKQKMILAGASDFTERAAWTWLRNVHPSLCEHLLPFANRARVRQDKGDYWWELRSCDYYDVLDAPKVVYPDITKGPRFALDVEGAYISNTAYCLATDDLFLLGLLNSRLAWFMVTQLSIPFGFRAGEYRYRMFYQYMGQMPVIDSAAETVRDLVGARIRVVAEFSGPSRTSRLQSLDDQVELALAESYGLSPAETDIVTMAGLRAVLSEDVE